MLLNLAPEVTEGLAAGGVILMLALNWLQGSISAIEGTTKVYQFLPKWTEEVGSWIRGELVRT